MSDDGPKPAGPDPGIELPAPETSDVQPQLPPPDPLSEHASNVHRRLDEFLREAESHFTEVRERLSRLIADSDAESSKAQGRLSGLVATSETTAQNAEASAQATKAALEATEALRAQVRAELQEATKLKTEALQAAEAAKGQAEAAKAEKDVAASHSTYITEAKGQAEAAFALISKLRAKVEESQRAAEKSQEVTKKLAEIAATIEERVGTYETELQRLVEEAKQGRDSLLTKLNDLLPGATSAGLAAAFSERKDQLVHSQRRWAGVFAGALGLVVLAVAVATGLVEISGLHAPVATSLDWRDQTLALVRRFALLAPALWFAIFSNRRYNTLVRLEEEYAHKVAMSKSFEGYKRELQGITEKDTTLAKHAESLIEVLRRSPVRLYGGKQGSDAPFEVLAEHSDKALEGVTKFLDTVAKLKK